MLRVMRAPGPGPSGTELLGYDCNSWARLLDLDLIPEPEPVLGLGTGLRTELGWYTWYGLVGYRLWGRPELLWPELRTTGLNELQT
jgi:hypothetical protein